MELVDLNFCSPSSKQNTLATTVGLELFGVFIRLELSCIRVLVKFGPSVLASGEISQGLEVIIEEIWRYAVSVAGKLEM